MIADLNTWDGSDEIATDLCLVGAGPAGLTIAREFLGESTSVLVLESGGLVQDAATQELNRVTVTGDAYAGGWYGRARAFGGAATLWGGQALPLTPIDFEERPWVPDSGWPITVDDLAPFYRRAGELLAIDDANHDTDLIERFRLRPPGFDADVVRYHFARWSPAPNLGAVMQPRLRRSRTIRVLLHATVTELRVTADHRWIDEIVVRSLGGRRVRIRPQLVVLCAGGIENARLLLISRDQIPKGLGNRHDNVGRYLQDHPGGGIGWVYTDDPDRLQHLFNQFHWGGRKYSVRLSAAPALQRRFRSLNASAAIMFRDAPGSAMAALREGYGLLRQRRYDVRLLRATGLALRRAPDAVRSLWKYLARGRSYAPGASFQVTVSLEQPPERESRVTLDASRDQFGLPRAAIHWRPGQQCADTLRCFASALQDQFERAKIGRLELEPWVLVGDEEWRHRLGDHYHHIGTTRMHTAADRGVVDPNCRVHDIDNLYIAGSSVFPTSGHSNPTLPLMALAVRLASTLKERLRQSPRG